ncbi:Asp-tRNA(Asn)/Glu-tRNA(Gln) amidotransferase subunit GatA [Candidatus Woesearchaeota archaeon]|nr:Asp-tRNA(Asn)/Glu-tRNA(Gln) amidotransferase subunit GatA [Candidatus Woesearchaeota archaeon]
MIDDPEEIFAECKKINEKYNYFTEVGQGAGDSNKGMLNGLYITVKDNICVKALDATASSKILKGYMPEFNATAIQRLLNQGATVIGKTVCDEFGFGSFNTNVGLDFKIPKNPVDVTRVTGGSSGGAAGITALANFRHVAIAESTGGSIECPAAFCGVVGFCPTYGLVSRYGLIDYANSLDKIGIMSKKVDEMIPVFNAMIGQTICSDSTVVDQRPKEFKPRKLKVGIIKESLKGMDSHVEKEITRTINALKKIANVEEVNLPFTFKYGIPTYYLIATSEASTNLAKLCGMRYGIQGDVEQKTFNEYFTEIRSANFGEEAKRRIMLGTFARMSGYRDAYYIKATKVRTLIIQEYKKLFQKYDVLISPTMPIVAPKFEEVKKLTPIQNYMMDILTVGPNLAGIPHASIPIHKSGLPVGLMAMTEHLEENKLFHFLKLVEEL